MDVVWNIDSHIAEINSRIDAIEARFEPPRVSFNQVFSSYDSPNISLAPPPPDSAFPLPTQQAPIPSVAPSGAPFDDIIQAASAQYRMDPNLIRAVIHQESKENPSARSSAGAMGLMQLMPDTARTLGVSDPYDARQNVFGGTRYLRGLLDQFNGSIPLALAAYNAGPNAVKRSGWRIPNYGETQTYVHNIMEMYHNLSGNRSMTPGTGTQRQ